MLHITSGEGGLIVFRHDKRAKRFRPTRWLGDRRGWQSMAMVVRCEHASEERDALLTLARAELRTLTLGL